MNYQRLFDTSIANASVKAWKEQGKKVMGTICCHVPEEIFVAAGILPVRLRATGCTDSSEAETWMSSLSCSFAKSCLEELINGSYDLDGVVASDGCLMVSRLFDNWEHINKQRENYYLYQIAAPRLVNDLTLEYYKGELNLLKGNLEKITGSKITDEKLTAAIDLYNETRRLIRELYELRKADNPVISGSDALKITLAATSMPKEEFNGLLKAFLADAKNRTPINDYRTRLMFIGSALDDPEYMKVVEDKGGLIVTDMLCFGSRYLWEPVEVVGGDIIGSMAKAYLNRSVCPRMVGRENRTDLHNLVLKMAKDFRVDGVLYAKMQHCECWGGEEYYLADRFKEANIQLLTVEREEIMANTGQLAIRAEAFVEMIEKGRE